MRIFIYEWVTGGGLAEHHGALPESLMREGLAMAQAVAADVAALDGYQAFLMRDMRVQSLVAPGAELVEVDSRAEHDAQFRSLAVEADAVLLIAPETDRALLRYAEIAESLGAQLISPSAEFIALASNKELTANQLGEANVPVPESLRLEPSDSLPIDFNYPAVVKPIDGAGSQDTFVVASANERPPAYAWPRRIEQFIPGTPASVALLCGEKKAHPLIPCRQRISGDGRLSFLGGSLPLAPGLAERAKELALKAIAALPVARGYIGVDLILGARPDGSEDLVLEINPRLTTSYVGLRAVARCNLVGAMLSVAKKNSPELDFDPRPLGFDADGAVYYD